jgi:hypothetical protein
VYQAGGRETACERAVLKSLAEIAIDEGLVTRRQVAAAAAVADRDGVPMVVALVRHCQLDEVALVAALRRETRVPLADPGAVEPDSDALREVQRGVCRRLRALPLSISPPDATRGRQLRVAMADPTDTVAVAELEHLTGCRIEVAVTPLSAIEEMIEHAYRSFVTEVMARQQVPPPTRSHGAPAAAAVEEEAVQSTTMPYHRISDEAHITLRHQALLDLLFEKRLLSEDEYEERVRQLMKQHDGEP